LFNFDAWVSKAKLRPLYLREWPEIHCTGGWVGPRAGLGGCGKQKDISEERKMKGRRKKRK
jgi:hypothetical protein